MLRSEMFRGCGFEWLGHGEGGWGRLVGVGVEGMCVQGLW
jgi:hypothetical protein